MDSLRGSGRTTRLLELAHKRKAIFVVPSPAMVPAFQNLVDKDEVRVVCLSQVMPHLRGAPDRPIVCDHTCDDPKFLSESDRDAIRWISDRRIYV